MDPINTRYFILKPQTDSDFQLIVKKLSSWWSRPKDGRSYLAALFDETLENVASVLNVYYFSDSKIEVTFPPALPTSAETSAVYLHENNQIMIKPGEISKDVLQHEIGHAVLARVIGCRPPAVVDELVAKFVDSRL